MALKKKSQMIIVSIMISIIALIILVILSTPIREEIGKARNTSTLNVTDPDITVVNKATITILDMGLFYFIGSLIAASIAYITGRKSFVSTITAIMVFVIVSILITPLKDFIIYARDSSHLFCTNPSITIGNNLACIIVDIWLFYFAIAAITAAITLIFVRKVLPKIKGEE